MNAIAQIEPTAAPEKARAGAVKLSKQQKAAIIVRLLSSEGARLPLAQLSEDQQTILTEQIAALSLIGKDTLREVVEEFCAEIGAVGLAFPGGLEGALSLLDGQISVSAASRLRRIAAASPSADPWERIAALPSEAIEPLLQAESAEVCAVVLSKLSVPKAAEVLGKLPGDKARRVAYLVSLTGNVAPETVRRIGLALIQQLDAVPPKAFVSGPVERVGAILNHAAAGTRDDVLTGLDEQDAAFAEQVRKAIFTFANIPARIEPRDIPKILRAVEQPRLVTALTAAGAEDPSAAFILANISQRMAATLREEIEARGPVKPRDAEEAMAAVVAAIRALQMAGEITLITADEE